jgi:cysteine-rich repeat protein
MTLRAATLTVDAGGFVRALGTPTTAGGMLNVFAGNVTIAGTADASGTPGGAISIAATGTMAASGSITARALARSAVGGSVQLTIATGNLSGPVSVIGGFDADGGDIDVDTTSSLTVTGTFDASGGDGGSIDMLIGSAPGAGNLVVGGTAAMRADATTAGGFGGAVELVAQGNGVSTGRITMNGILSATGRLGSEEIGGGSGGCVDVQASGDIRIESMAARLTAEGGAPDGDGGEVEITSDLGAVLFAGRASASVPGEESSGGSVTLDSSGDVTMSGSILVTAGDGGGGEAGVSSSLGGVTITQLGVIDASASGGAGGEGGGICVESTGAAEGPSSVLIEGRLATDGGSASNGGTIDVQGGDSVRVASTGTLHASGGMGGGGGGALTLKADPGVLLIEGPLVAGGGSVTGPGGIIALEAVGRVSVGAALDARGSGAGGRIGIGADTGPVVILSPLSAGSSSAAGGSIEINARGDVRVASSLVDGGPLAPGGSIAILGCDVTVCGLDSINCPAGGIGELSSLGPSGVNRITGRDSSVILGRVRANQASGRNQLVYDGSALREPLVAGEVTPPPTLVIDDFLLPCPACGNDIVDPPETCDDGNQDDGDGCSSSCQIEDPIPGDANGDFAVTLDDVRSVIAEIFDGDGDSISMVSGGGFAASPGVDANGDDLVSAPVVSNTLELLPIQ